MTSSMRTLQLSNSPIDTNSKRSNKSITAFTAYSPSIEPFNLSDDKTSEGIKNKIKQKFVYNNSIKYRRNQSMQNVGVMIKQNQLEKVNPELAFLQINEYLNDKNLINQGESTAENKQKNKNLLNLTLNFKNIKDNKQKHLLDTTLPLIHAKKSDDLFTPNKPIKANFLQFWLDEALDGDHNQQAKDTINEFNVNRDQREDHSYLSTVKKYKIDKKYLRSQNIPLEVINRLYNNLYMYTHGIDNIFTQLLKNLNQKPHLSSSNSINQHSQHQQANQHQSDEKLINVFWKTFIKLLENRTSFQTLFQKIESQYKNKIGQLKQLIKQRQREFHEQRERLEKVAENKERIIIQMQSTYSKLQTEHKITHSTLQLTDHAFNEEVQLRLKFEQKINHVYTSYEELKLKYEQLLKNLGESKEQNYDMKLEDFRIKQKCRQLQISNEELKYTLEAQRQKVRLREYDIQVMKQEHHDFQMSKQFQQDKKIEDDSMIQAEINRNKLLVTKTSTLQNRVFYWQSKYKELEKRIKEKDAIIQECKKESSELYEKYNTLGKNLLQYEQYKVYQGRQIQKLKFQAVQMGIQLAESRKQCSNMSAQIAQMTKQLSESRFVIQAKNNAIQKISLNIEGLKVIKNKYEQLYGIILSEKQSLQSQKNSIEQKYTLQQQQVIGMRLLQQNREKYIKQIELKQEKQKQMLKRKITGHSEMITKKESIILNNQKQKQQLKNQTVDLKYRIQTLQRQRDQKDKQIQKGKKEREYLWNQINQKQKLQKVLNSQLTFQKSKLIQQLKLNDCLKQQCQAVNQVFRICKQGVNEQVENLVKLYKQYREWVARKCQYVHPMVVQDFSMRLAKWQTETGPRLRDQKQHALAQKQRILCEKQRLEIQIKELLSSIRLLQEKVERMRVDKQKVDGKLKERENEVEKLKRGEKDMEDEIIKLKERISGLLTETKEGKSLRGKLEKQNQIKDQQIEKLNDSLTKMGNKIIDLQNDIISRQKSNPHILKIQELSRTLQIVTLELDGYKNKTFQSQQIQTQPQQCTQVVIKQKVLPGKFQRKNKFTNPSQPQHQSVQTDEQPDSIPVYLDQKITRILISQQKILTSQKSPTQTRQQKNISGMSYVMKSKQQQKPVNPVNKKQQFKRALKFTYMRR